MGRLAPGVFFKKKLFDSNVILLKTSFNISAKASASLTKSSSLSFSNIKTNQIVRVRVFQIVKQLKQFRFKFYKYQICQIYQFSQVYHQDFYLEMELELEFCLSLILNIDENLPPVLTTSSTLFILSCPGTTVNIF